MFAHIALYLIAECTIPYRHSCSQASIISFALRSYDSIISAAWIACSRKGRFRHKSRGIPRGMRRSGSVFGLPARAPWGFLSRGSRQPAASSQAEALSVGYLGFRAKISYQRCTFCEKKQGIYRSPMAASCLAQRASGPSATAANAPPTNPKSRCRIRISGRNKTIKKPGRTKGIPRCCPVGPKMVCAGAR